jgi:hypothetical protein
VTYYLWHAADQMETSCSRDARPRMCNNIREGCVEGIGETVAERLPLRTGWFSRIFCEGRFGVGGAGPPEAAALLVSPTVMIRFARSNRRHCSVRISLSRALRIGRPAIAPVHEYCALEMVGVSKLR